MQKMINAVQNYAWGSHDALSKLYGFSNPDNKPMAELWMGAHPLSSSKVLDKNGNKVSLRDEIAKDLTGNLGSAVAKRFGELPFLFKVLCAAQPLSIQVHPSKHAAEEGFAREESAGIAINAANRNYKDPNHKPELVYALTPFKAMNGFREFAEIAQLLQPVASAHPDIAKFIQSPDAQHLSVLFGNLLSMTGEQKSHALSVLAEALNHQQGPAWDAVRGIARFYPDDSGLFSPLLLNTVELEPGQSMFLYAETPHAYLDGVGLEIMANSDNVLRAGLTPKYIDVPELLANVKFIAKPANKLLTAPMVSGHETRFPIPVEDFAFAVHTLAEAPQSLAQESAAILFCVTGEATLIKGEQRIVLVPGESCYLPASESPVQVQGHGQLARVFNEL
ncbi:mannose-6-phosphate isomerase [Hafnia alvei]|uniref:mannose-6-phosphate isomerase n=1 Tax=Hafnia alvei TaxID=569 RepID=UPI0011EEE73D|nr:mannose-6-phosphate isomerase [Hafnia alvei]KAA0263828.1 mannose-6-phosphate isomerase [Hafnia alvei]